MNRRDLAEYVAKRLGVSIYRGTEAVTAVLDGLLHGLEKDGKVIVSSFGTWKIKNVPERRRRNPHTGEMITKPPALRMGFTPAQRVRDDLGAGTFPVSSRKRPKGSL